mgnify:CR=1 FL=1
MARAAQRPWYEEAFGADYRRVYPHRDLEGARPEVAFLLERGVRGRTLDLCCGFGRHSLLLREAGVEAFGLDLSEELLAAARDLPGWDQWLATRLVRADMTRIPFADRAFDSVVNLFSSFGYLGEAGDARVLREVARVLRPDGLAVLDLMCAERVRATLAPSSEREGPGFVLLEERRLVEGGRRVVKQVDLRLDSGERRRWREDVRLYEPDEIERMLAAAGLEPGSAWGDFEGRPAGPDCRASIFACDA